MDKTVKQLADELNISKQAIQYHIKRLPGNLQIKKDNRNTILLDEEVQKYITNLVANKEVASSRQNTTSNKQALDSDVEMFDLLKEQYEKTIEGLNKDKEFLQNRLIEAEKQANQYQHIIAMEIKDKEELKNELQDLKENKEALQIELKEVKEMKEKEEIQTEEETKKGWFSKWKK